MSRKDSPHPSITARSILSLALLVAAGPATADMRVEAPSPALPSLDTERSTRPVPAPDFSRVLRRSLERRGMLAPRTPATLPAPATLPVVRPRSVPPTSTLAPATRPPNGRDARE